MDDDDLQSCIYVRRSENYVIVHRQRRSPTLWWKNRQQRRRARKNIKQWKRRQTSNRALPEIGLLSLHFCAFEGVERLTSALSVVCSLFTSLLYFFIQHMFMHRRELSLVLLRMTSLHCTTTRKVCLIRQGVNPHKTIVYKLECCNAYTAQKCVEEVIKIM